jgi:hypothetical protein
MAGTPMGRPPRITDGAGWVEPGVKLQKQRVSNCIKVFWYNKFLAPDALSFCLDRDGHVVNKYHWASW